MPRGQDMGFRVGTHKLGIYWDNGRQNGNHMKPLYYRVKGLGLRVWGLGCGG